MAALQLEAAGVPFGQVGRETKMGGRLLELTAHHRGLVQQEISRAVSDAERSGKTVSTGSIAARLARSYDRSGLSAEQIASDVARLAARAGLPVKADRAR